MMRWVTAEAADKGKEDGVSVFMGMSPGYGRLSSRLSRRQPSCPREGDSGGLLDFPTLPSFRAATDATPCPSPAGPVSGESGFAALSLHGNEPRPDLVPRRFSGPDARGRKLSRRCACLALVLHLLIGGMVLAYARHVSLSPGANAGGGGGESGLIVLGRVSLGAPAGVLPSPSVSGPAGAVATTPAGAVATTDPPSEGNTSSADASPRQAEKADRLQPEEKAVPILASSPAKPAEKRSRPVSPRRAARTAPSGQSAAGEARPGGHPAAGAPAGERNGSEPGGLAQGSPAAGGPGTGTSLGASSEGTGLVPFGGKNGPSFKYFVKPEYPAQARRQGITGEVLLRILVNADGKAERIEVRKSAHDALTRAAREAVLRSTFHPLLRDGAPVSCWTLLPVTFTLERG